VEFKSKTRTLRVPLSGHTVKGVDKHYLAKLRISVLRAAAQRIADEIDNPRELAEGDTAVEVAETHGQDIQVESVESYLPPLEDLARRRHAHYLKREDLHKLVWTAPVSEIASQIGISDVGLAKACVRAAAVRRRIRPRISHRADIPLPGRGYWAKVSAGHRVEADPLPTAPTGLPELIRITGFRAPPTARA
jgi:hypothetical protein